MLQVTLPASLTVRLLGAPEIQVTGVSLNLNHIKARALLFYLAATGQAHTRDHLTALLWGDSPAAEARHSLRSTIYRLRQALRQGQADSVLVSQGDLLQLMLGDRASGCDVAQFRQLLSVGTESALVQAVFLYRGRFLQGFTLADSPMFEEWVRFEESQLNQAYVDTLDKLATWAEGRAEWATAIGYVQRSIQIDPLAEATQRRLMSLYLRNGMVGLALRQYRELEKMLRQEFAFAPAPETQALFQEAVRHQSIAEPLLAAASQPRSFRPQTLPFVGRETLLADLLAISQQVTARRGFTVLLQGEGGIGKSRLLAELADALLAQSQWLVLQGVCSPFDERLSYGPFVDAFQGTTSSDLLDILTESYEATPDARGRFFWRVLQSIRELAGTRPLLITIDDLQWANSPTLNLFGFLAMRLRGLPVMLVGTVQRAESIPALTRLISLGRRRGELNLFFLTPLSLGQVQKLLNTANIKATSSTSLADWLHMQSGGNPFILEEILAQMRADAIFAQVDREWQLDPARWLRWRSAFALPETTYDLVAWRLANLSAPARQLLEVLAVAGRPTSIDFLQRLYEGREMPLESILDDLASRRLVVEAAGDSYALPHHLLREALRHRLSSLRQRSIHRQLAEVLEANPQYQIGLPYREVTLHAVAGEDVDRARRFGLQFLADVPKTYAGVETVNLLQHLYDLLHPTASTEEMLVLTHTLGRLHQSLGHLPTAMHWHEQNLEVAQQCNDSLAQAAAYFEIGEVALVTNDYAAAQNAAQSGLEACATSQMPVPSELTGRGHRLLGAGLAMEGSDLLAAETHLQEAVAAHRLADNLGDLCATLFELGNVAAQRGDIPRALAFYQESAQAAEAGQVHYFLALAHNNFAYHSLLLGQPAAAQQAATQGLQLAEAHEMLGALLYLFSTQGEIHLYRGEGRAAAESFERGLALAEELGHLERQAGYRAGLALAARIQGNSERAITLLEEALALIEGQGYWHLRTRILLWLAETLLQCGRTAEAQPHLEAALLTTQSQSRALLLIQANRLQASLLASEGDWSAAQTLFRYTLEQAHSLNLPLEVARTQSIWGQTAKRYSPAPSEGDSLLAAAHIIFAAHDARAELTALKLIT